jgi:hypothetical protein
MCAVESLLLHTDEADLRLSQFLTFNFQLPSNLDQEVELRLLNTTVTTTRRVVKHTIGTPSPTSNGVVRCGQCHGGEGQEIPR